MLEEQDRRGFPPVSAHPATAAAPVDPAVMGPRRTEVLAPASVVPNSLEDSHEVGALLTRGEKPVPSSSARDGWGWRRSVVCCWPCHFPVAASLQLFIDSVPSTDHAPSSRRKRRHQCAGQRPDNQLDQDSEERHAPEVAVGEGSGGPDLEVADARPATALSNAPTRPPTRHARARTNTLQLVSVPRVPILCPRFPRVPILWPRIMNLFLFIISIYVNFVYTYTFYKVFAEFFFLRKQPNHMYFLFLFLV